MRTYLGEIRCEKPIQYFQWYWIDYINALLDKNNIDTCMESPRMLLNEILSEIQYNKFRNADNIKIFQTKLSDWKKKISIKKSWTIRGIEISILVPES